MRRIAVLCLAWFLVAPVVPSRAAEKEPRITLDGAAIELTASLREGLPCLALSSLPKLHFSVAYNRADGVAAIGLGRRSLLLRAGSTKALLDEKEVEGRQAPAIERGEFYVPVEWLAHFTLKAEWNARANTLALSWPKPYLFGVYLDKTGPVPRLVLEASTAVKASVFSLPGPDRLVVDLEGLELYEFIRLDDRENEYFHRLRAARNRPGVIRCVADLRLPFGYRLDSSQAGQGLFCLELDTLIHDVSIEPAGEDRKIAIKANHRPAWSASVHTDPDRLVIEIDRATLAAARPSVVAAAGSWLRRVECLTPAPGRVQIVATLARPTDCSIAPSRGNNNIIEVQPTQTLSRLSWLEGGMGFTLRSSGSISLISAAGHYPERLILTFLHAAVNPEEGEIPAGPISRYRVRQTSPGLAEVALDLRYDTQVKMDLSPGNRELRVEFAPSPLKGRIIVLDAGHGGVQTGAVGRAKGLREKDVNLDVTMRVKELLEGAGAIVHLTRVDDTYVPLYSRASFANRLPAEIFVSIHANSHDDAEVSGVEVFYYQGREEDRRLAALMFEDMIAASGLLPRGAKAGDYAVLRENQSVAVLVELAFLSNKAEEALLATEEFRDLAAWAIFRSLVRFARGEVAALGLPGPGLAD